MSFETGVIDHLTKAQKHLEQAYFYYKKKDTNQALLECDTALEIDSSLADIHHLRGLVLAELGRKVEAIEAYKQAIKLKPDFPEAKANLLASEDELTLFPRWLRYSLSGVFAFLGVTYLLEVYLLSKTHFLIVDPFLSIVLVTLYTPGLIVQLFLGSRGLEPGLFTWTIRIISSLTFGYLGSVVALKRKKVAWRIALALLLLYLLFFGVWGFLSFLASSFY